MALLLFFLFLALGISFICSILEAVVLSVTPSYIAQEKAAGSRKGEALEKVKTNIDRSLAAILSLNTIAHTVGAAGVGAQATAVFGEAYFGVISAILTLLILVVSEIIPKTLGANYWKELASFCLPVLKLVEISMMPLVIVAQGLTGLISKKKNEHTISRDEISALAWAGKNEGVLSAEESQVIRSIVHFRTLCAKDIMTPRTVVFSLASDLSCGQALDNEDNIKFSRIPVYQGEADAIKGFVRKDDVLEEIAQGRADTKLKAISRPVLTVLSNKPLLELLRDMTVDHYQVALIINEYGDLQGIATMEDLVESMLGLEIIDETDDHPDMRELARNLWKKRAQATEKIKPDTKAD